MEDPREHRRPLWIPPEPPPRPTGWRLIPYAARRYGFAGVLVLVVAVLAAVLYWNRGPSPPPALPPLESVDAASSPRTASPTASPFAGTARLTVQSEPPGASVWLTGDLLGRTPIVGDSVAAGVYVLSVRHDGYYRTDTVAVLRRGDAPTLRFQLVERLQAARRPPPAGRARPTAEATDRPAEPRASAAAASGSSPAPSGRIPTPPAPDAPDADAPDADAPDADAPAVDAPTPATGQLVLTSRPSGVAVRVNGRPRGSTPLTLDALPAGAHRVRLDHPGYRAWTDTVTVRAGGSHALDASLTAHTGRLRVLAQPWGTIYINGALHTRDADIWVSTVLPAGDHDVSAVHPSLGRRTRTVTVGPDSTVSLVLDLRPQAAPPASSGAASAGGG